MNYKEYYSHLKKYNLINDIWFYLIDLIKDEYNNIDNYLIILIIYFSLVDDGNIYISLNEKELLNKWKIKLDGFVVEEFENDNVISIDEYKLLLQEDIINNHLNDIKNVFNDNKFFIIDDDKLYIKKYYFERKNIINNLKRLFIKFKSNINFDYKDIINKESNFDLSNGQKEAFDKSLNNNLIITGGPGTGKTTSIVFILIKLLKEKDYNIYLTAPSGKAADRMKESILNNLNIVKDKLDSKIYDKISSLEGMTIHRLLQIKDNGFKYNKNNQFDSNSIFVIDEASMIDISLFDSLLSSIKTNSRIFIMGDKNQLPSVESGAVFANLLDCPSLKDSIVKLDESKRFNENTEIYSLASKINNGDNLEINDDRWKEIADFKIEPEDEKNECPIFYYNINKDISYALDNFGKRYFDSLKYDAKELDINIKEDDLISLFKKANLAKILCAQKNGKNGVININCYLKKHFVDAIYKSSNHHPGELMMINKNNKLLELFNGDNGILVSFKDDDNIYLMLQKSTNLLKENDNGYKKDMIFKIGRFLFYPFNLISNDDIENSYAITIHKSQGSDYKNILVITPMKNGHPLLNRQIIYTAITRTKGNTYIISNSSLLNFAKDNILKRDTNIIF